MLMCSAVLESKVCLFDGVVFEQFYDNTDTKANVLKQHLEIFETFLQIFPLRHSYTICAVVSRRGMLN